LPTPRCSGARRDDAYITSERAYHRIFRAPMSYSDVIFRALMSHKLDMTARYYKLNYM
jgi:hypothetical protein